MDNAGKFVKEMRRIHKIERRERMRIVAWD